MKSLENLRDVAARQLGGLSATPKLLGEIKLAAARQAEKKPARLTWRPLVAMGMALLICVGAYTWAVDSVPPKGPQTTATVLDSQPAGNGVEPLDPLAARALLDVPVGSISLGSEEEVPTFRSIFATAKGSNFPMVMVEGEAYRLLQTPGSMKSSLKGDSLGEVTEYTLEPALSSGGIVSNIVPQGEPVYVVAGMNNAMVAATVDGALRVFQRVSFAGTAVIGNETLEDTLCSAGNVQWMELSGVGAVDDASAAQSLMNTLLANASYQSASVSSGGSQSLLIGLSNGLTLQLMVSDDAVSACGTWSCPEFFEAFIVEMEK